MANKFTSLAIVTSTVAAAGMAAGANIAISNHEGELFPNKQVAATTTGTDVAVNDNGQQVIYVQDAPSPAPTVIVKVKKGTTTSTSTTTTKKSSGSTSSGSSSSGSSSSGSSSSGSTNTSPPPSNTNTSSS